MNNSTDRAAYRYQGVMLCILSVLIFMLTPYATESWQKIGSIIYY
jgi:hypothetical protein